MPLNDGRLLGPLDAALCVAAALSHQPFPQPRAGGAGDAAGGRCTGHGVLGLTSGCIQMWGCGTRSSTGSPFVAASLGGLEELGKSRAHLLPEHHLRHSGAGDV